MCVCGHVQLSQQLDAAESAAHTALQQAAVQHQQQLEGLAADHAARVDMLRGELAADATRRAGAEATTRVRLVSWLSRCKAFTMVGALPVLPGPCAAVRGDMQEHRSAFSMLLLLNAVVSSVLCLVLTACMHWVFVKRLKRRQ